MEKEFIIDEVFEETGKYLDYNCDMQVETVYEKEPMQKACSACGIGMTVLYRRYKEGDRGGFNLVVLQCSKCNRLFAYHVIEYEDFLDRTFEGDDGSVVESAPGEHSEDLESIPEDCSSAYSMAINSIEVEKKELFGLIQAKMLDLSKAGVSYEDVNTARNLALGFLKPGMSAGKIAALAAASVYLWMSGSINVGSFWNPRRNGKRKITEEKLEEIFGVTRKTIRKYVELLSKPKYLH